MKFEREHYINKLTSSKHNHVIKIVTGFRGRGVQIHLQPLSFKEIKDYLLN